MSGPKEGYWDFDYDPTPTRLADLSRFATKLDTWLNRHSSFIRYNLGDKALESARTARSLIEKHIKAGNPDKGFDAYGAAWVLLNRLYREAIDAKRKRQRQKHHEQLKRQQQQQERYEQLKRRQQREHRERLKQQQAATRLFSECKAVWQNSENQTLLKLWADQRELRNLAAALQAVAFGTPQQMQRKAQGWQQRFEHLLDAAAKRAEQNSKAVQEYAPRVQAEIQKLGELNLTVLTDDEQTHFRVKKDRLLQVIEDALSNEILEELASTFGDLRSLAEKYSTKVKTAQFQNAVKFVREALSRYGYSVTSRTEANGTRVLQASGFPLKSFLVEMNPNTNNMKLNVNGECKDSVQVLQAELAKNGMVLTMTDWGNAKPQSVHEHLQQNLRLGDTG